MGNELDIVDASDQRVLTQVRTQSFRARLIEFYPVSNALEAVMDVVINAVDRRPGSVSVLRLWGHGSLGEGGFATLVSDPMAYGHGSRLNQATVDRLGARLQRLRPFFAPQARVELRHCKAATPAGKTMLLELAKAWGVVVHASDKPQNLTTWQPQVWEATPTGQFRPIAGIEAR